MTRTEQLKGQYNASHRIGITRHMGDCVVVEVANDRANVRRVNHEVCDPAAAEVVKELNEEFQEEAAECASARAELAAAKTDAEFDRALMKIDILCNN